MSSGESFLVEVAYATPERQVVQAVTVPPGTRVGEAISLSGLLTLFPDVVVDPDRIGIFGQRAGFETAVCVGDRIEIYRPLTIDPMERRRLLAAAQGEKRKGKSR
jgi:putative ubiquitin-RnfH superfamily antitoxin RatB of RatAB toxin-antitoxin module